MRLTNVRSISAAWPSSSCVIPTSFRTTRKTLPNASPGSKEFSRLHRRNHVSAVSFRLRTIVIILAAQNRSRLTQLPGYWVLHASLPHSSTMSTSFPFLCFLTDDPLHQAFCLRYWAVDDGAWVEKFDAILHDSGISKPKLLEILKSSCRAYLRHFPCVDCGAPLEIRNRSQYAPLSGRPVGSAYYRRVNRCGSCSAAALAAEKRAIELALVQHRARVVSSGCKLIQAAIEN